MSITQVWGFPRCQHINELPTDMQLHVLTFLDGNTCSLWLNLNLTSSLILKTYVIEDLCQDLLLSPKRRSLMERILKILTAYDAVFHHINLDRPDSEIASRLLDVKKRVARDMRTVELMKANKQFIQKASEPPSLPPFRAIDYIFGLSRFQKLIHYAFSPPPLLTTNISKRFLRIRSTIEIELKNFVLKALAPPDLKNSEVSERKRLYLLTKELINLAWGIPKDKLLVIEELTYWIENEESSSLFNPFGSTGNILTQYVWIINKFRLALRNIFITLKIALPQELSFDKQRHDVERLKAHCRNNEGTLRAAGHVGEKLIDVNDPRCQEIFTSDSCHTQLMHLFVITGGDLGSIPSPSPYFLGLFLEAGGFINDSRLIHSLTSGDEKAHNTTILFINGIIEIDDHLPGLLTF